MKAWIKQDLEKMDLHNVGFFLQVFALIGFAYAIRLCS